VKENQFLPVSIILLALLAACSITPERNARLEEARSSYRSAESDPKVVNLAALELKEAGEALAKANDAWTQRKGPGNGGPFSPADTTARRHCAGNGEGQGSRGSRFSSRRRKRQDPAGCSNRRSRKKPANR
jgi:hypothetical protein